MNEWQVTLVTAFGRGESLALSLIEKGFSVRVLDFTAALPPHFSRGMGPFPLVQESYLPEHEHILQAAESMKNGLVFWLGRGPFELGGAMANFYLRTRRDVQVWKNGEKDSDFESAWLRRFLRQWCSKALAEPWMETSEEPFPAGENLKVLPPSVEGRILSCERIRALGHEYHVCEGLLDAQFEARQILRLQVQSGRHEPFESARWIWGLSALETEFLSAPVAERLFGAPLRSPEWVWMEFDGHSNRGPWSKAIPDYLVMIEDIHLPWIYSNVSVMRRRDTDRYSLWMKVPWERVNTETARKKWALDLQKNLNNRLPQAKWEIDHNQWAICPHALIFNPPLKAARNRWKNGYWLAPETSSALDSASRFELEVEIFHDLLKWRLDQIRKKEGAKRDRTLHAP